MQRVFRKRRVQSQRRMDLTARPGVKLYRAVLTQTGTGAPSATVLDNTLGPVVWTRTSVGRYLGTLAGSFPSGKTVLLVGAAHDASILATARRDDGDNVRVATTVVDGTSVDDELSETVVEILIYP
jgi:hypothetical protein